MPDILRKALMLTRAERLELCEYLHVAQKAMLDMIKEHEAYKRPDTPLINKLREYASDVHNWRERISAL